MNSPLGAPCAQEVTYAHRTPLNPHDVDHNFNM